MGSICEPAPTANSTTAMSSIPPFLSKTYDMVDDPSTNDVVSWSSGNNSFVVWNVPEFSKLLLPKYFKHNNFSSFVRQLNTYGFRKVDPDRWEFANEGFLRGQKQLLKNISRRKPTHVQQNQQQTQVQKKSSVGACVEVGKFGIEEEVERLKRDKNVLMQELVRLRQQQQGTEHQLQNVGQKVQVMEQRQQQMMSFLAKAVQSPGFLNQLVQQNNDGNRQIPGSNKKRRLPKDEEENCGGNGDNRQIIRYQPSINEAAQAMLRQFLNTSSSPKRESVSNSPGSFLLDDVPSSNSVDNGNSSNRASGVTLAEVSSNSGMSQVPEASLAHDPQAGLVQPNLGPSPTQGVAAGASWSPESDLFGRETGNGECFDPIMAVLDGSLEINGDAISPECGEGEMNELMNENPKLPGVQDPFWEQFFADETPVVGDTDEILSGSVENKDHVMEQEPNEWTGNQLHLNYLTEQMGLLSSETQRK
uniref:Heat stress transcription factor A-1b n=1 Tax=Noccaea caerulescens TaxID=107243 RepID=A0A1J3HFR1_NOCCA